MAALHCRRHPRALAGWSCERCAAALCPDCVVRSQVGAMATEYDGCTECGGPVELLTRHRAEKSPFAAEVPRAFRLPLGREGVLSLVLTGGVVGLLRWMTEATFFAMKPFAALVAVGVLFSWFFHVVHAASIGADPFEVPDFRDFFTDVVEPGARALFALSFVWAIPLVLYFVRTGEILTRWESIAFWLYAWAYAPIALLFAAIDHEGWSLNPVVGGFQIRRLGREYWVLVAAMVPVGLAEWVIWAIAEASWFDRLGLIGAWVASAALLYPLFVAAYLLGKLLFLHGDRVEYGRADDYRVPLLEGVTPRGTRPSATL
jgi:hypothetical protein